MVYRAIFVDSDTLLDLLLERIPFYYFSRVLFTENEEKLYDLYTSSLIVANIHYIISKNVNKSFANTAVKEILNLVTVLPFNVAHINSAVSGGQIDFEDTIQYYIARQNSCDVIISRNIRHYKNFDIPVLTAEQFLKTIL